ncbi:MAG: hypothetical protein D6679_02560, partial [Candidatus Hydrogenedentota bacterium]
MERFFRYLRHQPTIFTRLGERGDEIVAFVRKPMAEIKSDLDKLELDSALLTQLIGLKGWPKKDSGKPIWPRVLFGTAEIEKGKGLRKSIQLAE